MKSERVLMEGRVGPAGCSDGAEQALRQARDASLVVTLARGKYVEAASRGKVFHAASQADTTWSVALHTTHTGLVVSNPVGSGYNLAILQASFALCVAPAGVANIGLFGGFLAAGIATHTTPLTVYSAILGGPGGVAKADAAATLVGTPVWLMQMQNGFTAAALPGVGQTMIDVDGSIIVPPGGYCGIAALTVVHGLGSMSWEEILI